MLALAAGTGIVALTPMIDRAERPSGSNGPAQDGGSAADGGGGDPDVVDVVGRSGTVFTIAVELVPGWAVPELADSDDDELAGILPVGTATVGGRTEVRFGSVTVVLRASTIRRLGVRLGSEGNWGPWSPIGIGQEEAPDGLDGEEGSSGGLPATTPILIPPGATTLEVVDLDGLAGGVDVVFLPSFDGPVDAGFDGPASPSLAAADAPTIMPRSAWTSAPWASENGSCGDGPEVADHAQAVVVHHTVTTNGYGADQVDDLLRAIHYSHTEVNGWCDIGYNFVVDRFGRIWEARTGSIEQTVIGGHARGFNTGTVGVALLGQHQAGASPSAQAVSQASEDAVEALANWKLGAEGVDPNGRTWLRNRSSASRQRLAGETWHYVPTVLGHRDLGLTSCPGSHGMNLVGALPDRLAARRDTQLPYTWSDWRPHGHGPALVVADARGGVRPAGSAGPWSPAPANLGGDSVIAVGGDLDGGFLLTASGGLAAYGSAPAPGAPVAVGGPVDLVVRSNGSSGWVLDGTGILRGFAGAPDITTNSSVSGPVAAAVADDGRGYVLEGSGRLVPVGGLPGTQVGAGGVEVVDLALSGPASGWVLLGSGRLAGFGGAADHEVDPSASPIAVVAASSAVVAEPGGWVLDRHGQLWPFGGARYVLPVATDVRAGDAVDLATVGVVSSGDFLASGDARFLDRLHRLFLGRSASATELDLGATRLEQGDDRIDLATELARSDHWAGASLDQMYRDVLGREPDAEGRSYWMGEIATGLKLQDLGTYFYGSGEYATAAGSNEAYVRGLYQVLLHRQPDAEGLQYWTDELASGRADPPDIATGFYSSIESRRDRARRLNEGVLGVTPSTERRDELAERLSAVGDVGLAAELAAGSDFYRLASQGSG